jgi:hypothetical protein
MIILVVLVAIAYMAQAAAIQQLDERDFLQYLLNKRGCSDIGDPCTRSRDCCGNRGSAYEGIAARCDYGNGICVLREK